MAMKALAKEPAQRYPNVETLRRDIERFQDGRSVSAKEDTFREAVWKLVKRNKVGSFISAVALILLFFLWGWMSSINRQERLKTENERLKTERERQDRFDQAKNSVPAYLRAGQLCVNQRQFDDALDQVNIALLYDQGNPDAQLLKGKVLIVKQKFKEAEAELQQYLRRRPDDPYAGKLTDCCRRANASDPRTIAPIVELFLDKNESALAMGMGDFQDKILENYRKRIEKAWPGLGGRLKLDTDGKLDLDLVRCGKQVTDLVPLQGMPLTRLSLQGTAIPNVKPLMGMPLTSLNLIGTGIRDLTPLKGMQLTELSLSGCWWLRELTPLKGMLLTSLIVDNCQVSDLTPLQGMKLKHLVINVTDVTDLTPLDGMALQEINLTPRRITKGMDVLRRMKSLNGIAVDKGRRFPPEEFWKRYDAGEFNK